MLTQLIVGGNTQDRLDYCQEYKNSNSLILDGTLGSILIEQIRDFQKQFALSNGVEGSNHFIFEAQSLTLPSQHALLKTIEETPPKITLLITADKSSSLIATILSRCQIIKIKNNFEINPEATKKIYSLLKQIVSSNPAQLITLAEKINKDEPKTTLLNTLITLRNSLLIKPNLKRVSAIRLTEGCLNDLKNNLNSLLSIEHYLVEVRRLML